MTLLSPPISAMSSSELSKVANDGRCGCQGNPGDFRGIISIRDSFSISKWRRGRREGTWADFTVSGGVDMSGSLDICLFSTSSVRGCAFNGAVDRKNPEHEDTPAPKVS